MKKLFWLMLAMVLCVTSVPIYAQAAGHKIGDRLGSVISTDIKTFINGSTIPSWNVNGQMCVKAEDLRNYGFTVTWDEKVRALKVTAGDFSKTSPIPVADTADKKVGAPAGDYVYTDIVCYVNGEKVESFSVNGGTIIFVDALKASGATKYDDATRSLDLTVKPAKKDAGKSKNEALTAVCDQVQLKLAIAINYHASGLSSWQAILGVTVDALEGIMNEALISPKRAKEALAVLPLDTFERKVIIEFIDSNYKSDIAAKIGDYAYNLFRDNHYMSKAMVAIDEAKALCAGYPELAAVLKELDRINGEFAREKAAATFTEYETVAPNGHGRPKVDEMIDGVRTSLLIK